MKRRVIQHAFLSLIVASVASACNGTAPLPPSLAQTPVQPQIGFGSDGLPRADAAATCTAKPVPIPGTYVTFVAAGTVKGTTFTASSGSAFYFLEKFTKATPPPTPTPTASPTTGPTPPPEWYYYGTYALKKNKGGCAYLIATVNGKPFKGTHYNGIGSGAPKFTQKWWNVSIVSEGPMTMIVKNLSASGGTGSLTLMKPAGGTFDTGTVHFVGRMQIP